MVISYPAAGTYDLIVTVYHNSVQLVTKSTQVTIEGSTLAIITPDLSDITVGEEYAYSFVGNNIPETTQNVVFEWSFGVGNSGVGNSGVLPVTDGKSSASEKFTYEAEGKITVSSKILSCCSCRYLNCFFL